MINPGCTKVAFSDDKGVIYVVGMNGRALHKFAEGTTVPDWSPDGNLLAVKSFMNGVYQSHILHVRNGKCPEVSRFYPVSETH
jgi:hypothetical protein